MNPWLSLSVCLLLAIAPSPSSAFLVTAATTPSSSRVRVAAGGYGDTPETLPAFADADEYLKYLDKVSALPKGFACGTADGTFVSVEAPSLGNLKIRGTVIYLTEGPTDSWAACFTSNKVG